MDEDKNISQTQEEVPVEKSPTQDSEINLDNVDPRLIVTDETETPEEVENQEPAKAEPEVEEPTTEPEPPEEANPEPEPVSRRGNKRLAEVTRKLAETQQQLSQAQQSQGQQRQIIGEGDYDLDQVNNLAQNYGDQRYSEGLALANTIQFTTRLDIDAPKIESKYPALNPQDEKFNPGIADWSTQLYYKAVGLKTGPNGTFTVDNPNIRYGEFIDGLMEAVDTLAADKSVDSNKNVARQAAQQGVRPSSTVSKTYAGDDPSRMTTAQLRERVNQDLGI